MHTVSHMRRTYTLLHTTINSQNLTAHHSYIMHNPKNQAASNPIKYVTIARDINHIEQNTPLITDDHMRMSATDLQRRPC